MTRDRILVICAGAIIIAAALPIFPLIVACVITIIFNDTGSAAASAEALTLASAIACLCVSCAISGITIGTKREWLMIGALPPLIAGYWILLPYRDFLIGIALAK